MSINYEEDSQKEATEGQLAYITRLANEQKELEDRVAKGTELLKELNKELQLISTEKLPVAMKEVGLETFKTTSGLTVDVSEKLTMKLPKKKMTEIVAWMIEVELEALIKNQVVFTFDKGQDADCVELIEFLSEGGYDNKYQRSESVNTSSLKAAIKELREQGTTIPLKLLGGYDIKEAKITKS